MQGAPSGPENNDAGNFPQERSLIDQQNAGVMTGEQYPQQDMAYKKVNNCITAKTESSGTMSCYIIALLNFKSFLRIE